VIASSGREALRILDCGEQFDVIVCDLMMPDLGGTDFHERVRALYPGLEHRIVFMTGGAFTDRATRFLDNIPNVCLAKPFEPERLFEEIERVTHPPATRRPEPRARAATVDD
jgi:CheY-like chemotaxis protein